jgi:hypothetical protein
MSSQPTSPPKLPIVYIGPNSPKLGLVRFSHYLELNDNIKAAIKAHPALDLLFIPLEQFGTRAQAVYAGTDPTVGHVIRRLLKDEVF